MTLYMHLKARSPWGRAGKAVRCSRKLFHPKFQGTADGTAKEPVPRSLHDPYGRVR